LGGRGGTLSVQQAPPASQKSQCMSMAPQAKAARCQTPPRCRPPPAPPASQAPPAQQQQQQQEEDESQGIGGGSAGETWTDYTEVPKEMDKQFQALDKDGLLRPTIINPGDVWTKKVQKALLGNLQTSKLYSDEQKSEKQKAFDLLDALTRSGALPVDQASLHVVLAATHCFDKTVIDTVVQDNVSPIEKVEHSMLIMASTLHRKPASQLVQPSQLARVQDASPILFAALPASN